MTAVPGDDRFNRQQAIPGWSQEVLSNARVLVAGAGALGNEALKNLALLGIGKITIVDRDVVERSNLSRSVLFREEDIGQSKVVIASQRVKAIHPDIQVFALTLDLTTELGSGLLAEYDLLLGCLDSIEARWKLNRLCRAAHLPWIDAGIDASRGQISFFAGDSGPCYECGMTASMWQRMHESRSCLLAQQSLPERRIATTATLASLVAAFQVQEAVAQLHHAHGAPRKASQWTVLEPGDRVTLSVSPYSLSVLHARHSELCQAHDENCTQSSRQYLEISASTYTTTAHALLDKADADVVELDWDLAVSLGCFTCGREAPVCLPAWKVRRETLTCPTCGRPLTPSWTSRIAGGSPLADCTLDQLGVPPRAYLPLVTREGHRFEARLTEPRSVRT